MGIAHRAAVCLLNSNGVTEVIFPISRERGARRAPEFIPEDYVGSQVDNGCL